MYEFIKVEIIDRIQVLTLNRPKARNAINYDAAQEIADAMTSLDANPDVALGILTGAENTFCAGMDLKDFGASGRRPYAEGRGFAGICEKPPVKPLIAAVEGYALAGGCEIALACDLIIAADNANFGLPEVKRGLVPGSGGMLRLPSRIPYHIAMEAVLTGDMIPAARAHAYGLVNQLVQPGQALAAALDMGRRIAENGPLAVQTAKRILTMSRDWRQADMFDMQRPLIAHIFTSADAREGAVAFAEKRKPVWQGK